jgi:hypothetical protein
MVSRVQFEQRCTQPAGCRVHVRPLTPHHCSTATCVPLSM